HMRNLFTISHVIHHKVHVDVTNLLLCSTAADHHFSANKFTRLVLGFLQPGIHLGASHAKTGQGFVKHTLCSHLLQSSPRLIILCWDQMVRIEHLIGFFP